VVVVGELYQGEECVPIVLSFSDEDLQVLFQFLIDLFCLSVVLWVVGGGHRGLNSQQSVQLLHEDGNKLRSMVRHNLLQEAMELPNILKVEVRCSGGGGDRGDCFDEVGVFTYGVDGYHDGVVST